MKLAFMFCVLLFFPINVLSYEDIAVINNDVSSTLKYPATKARLPVKRYKISTSGTVTDEITGLMWKQCEEGKKGKDCKGEAKPYTWQQAVNHFKQIHFAAHTDWRLPTLKELKTLVYCSNGVSRKEAQQHFNGCDGKNKKKGGYQTPTIDSTAFPNSSPSWLWSSTPYAMMKQHAWYIQFRYGATGTYHVVGNGFVRLVRQAQ
ncbi:MAG: DUF1566 domain-containing protein [Cocleimonas sp.]|nr:DUF1566 domain-containing protein [Cocleimonas sp.]